MGLPPEPAAAPAAAAAAAAPLSNEATLAKSIETLCQYKVGGEGLRALKTLRIYVNNAIQVSIAVRHAAVVAWNGPCTGHTTLYLVSVCPAFQRQHPGEEKFQKLNMANDVRFTNQALTARSPLFPPTTAPSLPAREWFIPPRLSGLELPRMLGAFLC